MVHQLRRLGRRLRAGHRRGQHVLRPRGPYSRTLDDRRSSRAAPAGAARASRRPRSPPSSPRRCTWPRRRRPTVEAPVVVPALPVPRPRHRVQRLMAVDPRLRRTARVVEPQLARAAHRRRPPTRPAGSTSSGRTRSSSSSTTTTRTRPCYDTVRSADLEVLGAPPASRRRAASSPPASAAASGARPRRRRWRTHEVVDLADRLGDAGCRVPPNHVYLTDGVAGTSARRLGTGRAARPASRRPSSSSSSTARPAPAPGRAAASRSTCPATAARTCSSSTPGCAPATPAPRTTALHDHCVIHEPWLDRHDGTFGRRGRARRRRRRAPRPPGRPRHVHLRRRAPAVPRRPHPPRRRADQLRRR